MTTDAARGSSRDEVTQLRKCLNDLVSLVTSPTLWTDGKPPHTVSNLAEALLDQTNDLIAANERLTKEAAERRRSSESLSAGELNFQLLVETIPALVWRGSPEGELDYLNQRAVEYLGHSAESLANGRWIELVHPDHRDATVQRWLQSTTTGSSYSDIYRLRRADGQYRWIQSVGEPFRDEEGRITHWYGLVIDIDERQRAEEALRESERESRVLLDTIPGLVATLTPAGEVDAVNDELVEYCGQGLEAMKQWGTNGTVHAEDVPRIGPIFAQAIAAREPYDFEMRIRRFDGVYRWLQVRGLPRRDSNGRTVRWYVLLTEVDERKQAEAELKRAYDSFSDAQRLSKTGSFITDLVGDNHTWSEETYRIFEFDPGTTIRVQRVRDAVHPDDLPTFESVIARGMTGVDVKFAFRIVTPAGA